MAKGDTSEDATYCTLINTLLVPAIPETVQVIDFNSGNINCVQSNNIIIPRAIPEDTILFESIIGADRPVLKVDSNVADTVVFTISNTQSTAVGGYGNFSVTGQIIGSNASSSLEWLAWSGTNFVKSPSTTVDDAFLMTVPGAANNIVYQFGIKTVSTDTGKFISIESGLVNIQFDPRTNLIPLPKSESTNTGDDVIIDPLLSNPLLSNPLIINSLSAPEVPRMVITDLITNGITGNNMAQYVYQMIDTIPHDQGYFCDATDNGDGTFTTYYIEYPQFQYVIKDTISPCSGSFKQKVDNLISSLHLTIDPIDLLYRLAVYSIVRYQLSKELYGIFSIDYLLEKYYAKFIADLTAPTSRYSDFINFFTIPEFVGYEKYFWYDYPKCDFKRSC